METPRLPSSPAALLYGLAALSAAIIGLDVPNTVLRFENPSLNYFAAVFLSLSVPGLVLAAGFKFSRPLFRRVAFVMAALTLIPAVAFSCVSLISAYWVEHGIDPSFVPTTALQVDSSTFRLYRVSSGPTNSFEVALQKERPLLLGLKVVTRLRKFNSAADGRLELLPTGKIRVTIFPYGTISKGELFELEP